MKQTNLTLTKLHKYKLKKRLALAWTNMGVDVVVSEEKIHTHFQQ